MNHINCNETLFQIEDLMLNICLNRYYWRDAIVELQRNREAATNIYDPELEYSPLLQGYFDLMSMSHASDSGRTINPRRSPLQSRTAFQNFCDGLMDEQDHFILRHKRQRKRNYTAIKNYIEDLLDSDCEFQVIHGNFNKLNHEAQGVYQFHQTLTEFRSRILKRDTCCEDLLDYSWVIEQDREEGLICRYIFIYVGSSDIELDNYATDRTDKNYELIEEENLLNIIHTLSNHDVEDQYLRARIKRMRCFG
ncbi:hypothetical protein QTA56_05705 [Acinetobacter sp. VNH17]|uniref:Uncharacterized protein n=1 Tax=Acinetobacter thutiue TaxID=2998078 RepID=A0ABT7WM32_9GAMM|nr:hypothetical protein [Acinetobacter thutiue]MCY6411637.1 hypothetical protein [Acinetobacter thutiue]MDN0013739.1 hypothetical protein [Acinetobacter thutiue]